MTVDGRKVRGAGAARAKSVVSNSDRCHDAVESKETLAMALEDGQGACSNNEKESQSSGDSQHHCKG